MVLFNYSTKELTAKVVYYGPGLCGKTTNLHWIHEKLPIKNKGKMLSLATETDRTLFFDFLPIELGTIRGMKTRIQLYTVPGQVFYNATRRMVLKGADCVVFVCDSQEAMLEANVESLENLRENLEVNEIDPDEAPMVMQYNKRDLPNALPIEILNDRLNPRGLPAFEAVATRGVGVEETLRGVTGLVFRTLASKYGGVEGSSAPTSPPKSDLTPAPEPPPPPLAVPPAPRPASSPPPPPPPTLPPLAMDAVDEADDELLESLELHPTHENSGQPEIVPDHLPDDDIGEEEISFDTPQSRVDPKSTLIKGEDEAAELRRRIGRPVVPDVNLEKLEEEVADEEEIESLSLEEEVPSPPPPPPARQRQPPGPPPASLATLPPVPAATPQPPGPSPSAARLGSAVQTIPPIPVRVPEPTVVPVRAPQVSVRVGEGTTEHDILVPIEVRLNDGNQVSLMIRLALTLKIER
jgi:signal recognition particle receptor subunit beta